jgi:hypothetical protein
VRGAIRPRVPELQHDLPAGRQMEPVLRDGWPQRVPAESREAVPLVGRDPHAGIQVESFLTRGSTRLTAGVTAPGSGHPALAKLVLDWHRPARTRPRAESRRRRGVAALSRARGGARRPGRGCWLRTSRRAVSRCSSSTRRTDSAGATSTRRSS